LSLFLLLVLGGVAVLLVVLGVLAAIAFTDRRKDGE